MPKRSLRQQLLEQRRQLDDAECRQRSHLVQRRLLEIDVFRQARVIALYASIHNEVATDAVRRAALEGGKTICYPRIRGQALDFVVIHGPGCLAPGAFGIPEPTGAEVLDNSDIDLMLVPGVAFDRSGYRLGYGQGYYDRAVSSACPAMLAGLAYDFQLVDALPTEAHDIRLDLVIMESGHIAFDHKQQPFICDGGRIRP